MKKFTIFGNPVKHSKSPQMQNSGFKHIGLEANYTKTKLEDGDTIKELFLKNNFDGANITVPHKELAFKHADEVIGLANQIGAANTYINQDGKVLAYNTDAPGFLKAIEEFGDIKNVLILGAGGTARALAVAFKEKGVSTTILNRSKNRLDFFEKIGCSVSTWDDFQIASNNYKLIVNTTSAGLNDQELPSPKVLLNMIFANAKFAVDCIYGKETPFLKIAKDKGLQYKDGEDMLLYQGVLAFELFTGCKADKHLIEAMRKGLKEG